MSAIPSCLQQSECRAPHINAQTAKRIKIQLLNVFWRRFQDDLKLIVMLQPVGVFAVAAVRRSPAGLHVGGVPALRPDGSEKSRGVKGAGAHFEVQRLQNNTTLFGPELLKRHDQPLKG